MADWVNAQIHDEGQMPRKDQTIGNRQLKIGNDLTTLYREVVLTSFHVDLTTRRICLVYYLDSLNRSSAFNFTQ